MFDFLSCWERIKSQTEITTHSQLADILGVYPSMISKKKKKNIFPIEWAEILSEKYDLSKAWIMTGEGQTYSQTKKTDRDDEDQIPTDEGKFVECHWNDKFIKKVALIKGALYEVDPLNPAKKQLKGEKVIMIDTGYVGPTTCLRIDSKWHMTRRDYTEIDPCDLKLITKHPDLRKLGINDS